MPAIRVNSPSFSFAPCVCLPATRVDSSQSLHACDSVRALCLMPEIDLRRLQNQPSEAPKSSPDRPGTSRSGPERHKSVPSASKERPRASQKRPKSGQDSPKSSQERPKSAPRAPKNAQERPKKIPNQFGFQTLVVFSSAHSQVSQSHPLRFPTNAS